MVGSCCWGWSPSILTRGGTLVLRSPPCAGFVVLTRWWGACPGERAGPVAGSISIISFSIVDDVDCYRSGTIGQCTFVNYLNEKAPPIGEASLKFVGADEVAKI